MSAAGTSASRRGPKLPPLLLSPQEHTTLERWAHQPHTQGQAQALRARIVLACAGPQTPPITQVAAQLHVAADTVRKWRRRFLAERLNGLTDKPHHHSTTITAAAVGRAPLQAPGQRAELRNAHRRITRLQTELAIHLRAAELLANNPHTTETPRTTR